MTSQTVDPLVGTLDPTKTALVLIEYQNEFTTPGGKLHDAVKDVMEKTNSKYCAQIPGTRPHMHPFEWPWGCSRNTTYKCATIFWSAWLFHVLVFAT